MDIRDLVIKMGYITENELESLETQIIGSQTLLELLVEQGVLTTQDVKDILRESNVKPNELSVVLGVVLLNALSQPKPIQNIKGLPTTLNQPITLKPPLQQLDKLEEIQQIETTLEVASDEEIRLLLQETGFKDIVLDVEERIELELDGWVTLISSNVKATRIVNENDLQIMFHSNNAIYQWNNRAVDFVGLVNAPSHGKYVWKHLYGLHTLRVR